MMCPYTYIVSVDHRLSSISKTLIYRRNQQVLPSQGYTNDPGRKVRVMGI
jgi:hypothetical protein